MEAPSIEITVNGKRQTVPPETTVLALLKRLQLDPARVAVELDRNILKQANWGRTQLRPGARLEIVQFVGGG